MDDDCGILIRKVLGLDSASVVSFSLVDDDDENAHSPSGDTSKLLQSLALSRLYSTLLPIPFCFVLTDQACCSPDPRC